MVLPVIKNSLFQMLLFTSMKYLTAHKDMHVLYFIFCFVKPCYFKMVKHCIVTCLGMTAKNTSFAICPDQMSYMDSDEG